MGRRNNKPIKVKPKQQNQSKSVTTSTVEKELTLADRVEQIMNKVLDSALPQDLDGLQSNPMPENTTENDILALFNSLEQTRQVLEKRQIRLDDRQADLDEKLKKQQNAEQSLESKREEHEQKVKKFKEESSALIERQQTLNALEVDLDRREMDARFGFEAIYQEVREKSYQSLSSFSADLEKINQEFMDKRRDELTGLQSRLAELNASAESNVLRLIQELETQRENLAKEQLEVNRKLSDIRRERNELEAAKQIFQEDQQSQAEIIERKVAVKAESYKNKIESLEELHKQAATDRDHFRQKLATWDKVRQKVGKDPESILESVAQLEAERDRLTDELRARPSQSNIERIEILERQQTDWEQERWQLLQENSELKSQVTRMRIQALEVENQRDLILTLEARARSLEDNLRELKGEVDRRIGDEKLKSPFPQCYAFDQDPDLQHKLNTHVPSDLKVLVADIQKRIARKGLFYEARDVRSFLAGLAMSRTMILQGISGTGKTSLPWNFAEAIGGGREIIEVQAGWRDRDDLLGHYNAFEQKFYESKFLQALYKAQCPAYSDRVFVILLDEMNLSNPEQYFADLLSALQMDPGLHQKIDLISSALPSLNYPRAFINDKRSIRVPENVWFIGTANQDETTKDIADKTYDRSHILELPRGHRPFEVGRDDSTPQLISRSGLSAAFDQAKRKNDHGSAANQTLQFLETVSMEFSSVYELGWGNRLKKQVENYVPVIMDSGGSWAEATDDILSMKLLRKLRNRYEIQPSGLDKLEKILTDAWKKSGKEGNAEAGLKRSFALIKDEKRRKPGQQMDEAE
jgi:hypothetical protein